MFSIARLAAYKDRPQCWCGRLRDLARLMDNGALIKRVFKHRPRVRSAQTMSYPHVADKLFPIAHAQGGGCCSQPWWFV